MTASELIRWRPVVIVGALPLLVAVLIAVLSPVVYRAEVVMVPVIARSAQQSVGVGVASGLSSIAAQFGMGSLTGASDAEQEAIATLTSRSFIEALIAGKNLLPILFKDDWDEQAKGWNSTDPKDIPTVGQGYRFFVEDIVDVKKDMRTGLVTLTVDWTDRHLAAQWASELVSRINEKMRQRALQEANDSLVYLAHELQSNPQLEVQQAIYRIIELNLTQSTLANVHKEYAFRVIDPAVVPDERDHIRPKRVVIVAIGMLLGLLFAGCCAALYGLVDLQQLIGVRSESRT